MSVKSVKCNVLIPHCSPSRYQVVILNYNFFAIFWARRRREFGKKKKSEPLWEKTPKIKKSTKETRKMQATNVCSVKSMTKTSPGPDEIGGPNQGDQFRAVCKGNAENQYVLSLQTVKAALICDNRLPTGTSSSCIQWGRWRKMQMVFKSLQ